MFDCICVSAAAAVPDAASRGRHGAGAAPVGGNHREPQEEAQHTPGCTCETSLPCLLLVNVIVKKWRKVLD